MPVSCYSMDSVRVILAVARQPIATTLLLHRGHLDHRDHHDSLQSRPPYPTTTTLTTMSTLTTLTTTRTRPAYPITTTTLTTKTTLFHNHQHFDHLDYLDHCDHCDHRDHCDHCDTLRYLFRCLFYFISFTFYVIQKNKEISIINAKLGRDTTTAVGQLQWSQILSSSHRAFRHLPCHFSSFTSSGLSIASFRHFLTLPVSTSCSSGRGIL